MIARKDLIFAFGIRVSVLTPLIPKFSTNEEPKFTEQ